MRSRAPALARTWNVSHRIEPDSPLFGLGPEDLVTQEIEITISVTGVDEHTLHSSTLAPNDVRAVQIGSINASEFALVADAKNQTASRAHVSEGSFHIM